MQEDLLKQMLVSFLRKALFAIGTYLVTRGWLTQDLANSMLGDSFLWATAGAIIVAGSLLWQYMKIKFNVNVAKEAIKAPSTATLSDVKEKVLETKSLTTSL